MTREQFISDLNAWGSHRKLLWNALEATKHLNKLVVEFGCGDNSTPFIKRYCQDENLRFWSYESDQEWAERLGSHYVEDWDGLNMDFEMSVCLIDMAPGGYRKKALKRLTNCEIIVIHDSETPGWNSSDYQVRPLFKNFKFVKDDIPKEKGSPWTTALSNTIDVAQWKL